MDGTGPNVVGQALILARFHGRNPIQAVHPLIPNQGVGSNIPLPTADRAGFQGKGEPLGQAGQLAFGIFAIANIPKDALHQLGLAHLHDRAGNFHRNRLSIGPLNLAIGELTGTIRNHRLEGLHHLLLAIDRVQLGLVHLDQLGAVIAKQFLRLAIHFQDFPLEVGHHDRVTRPRHQTTVASFPFLKLSFGGLALGHIPHHHQGRIRITAHNPQFLIQNPIAQDPPLFNDLQLAGFDRLVHRLQHRLQLIRRHPIGQLGEGWGVRCLQRITSRLGAEAAPGVFRLGEGAVVQTLAPRSHPQQAIRNGRHHCPNLSFPNLQRGGALGHLPLQGLIQISQLPFHLFAIADVAHQNQHLVIAVRNHPHFLNPQHLMGGQILLIELNGFGGQGSLNGFHPLLGGHRRQQFRHMLTDPTT